MSSPRLRIPARLLAAAGVTATTAGLLAVAAGSASAATPTPTSTSPSASALAPSAAEKACDASLPAIVRGAPAKFSAGESGGDYVWHDDSGWHLRVTQVTHSPHVYTGTIRATGTIHDAAFKLEPGDRLDLSADRKTLTYRFVNYGRVDGVDFTDSCASTTGFALARDGHELSTGHVHLGAHGAAPESVPFTLERS